MTATNLQIKILRKALAANVIGMVGSRELRFKFGPGTLTPERRAAIAAKYPGIVLLNDLSDEQLDRVIENNGVDPRTL